jgi:hypothetical protein
MPEDSKSNDPGTLWREQPAEPLPVNLDTRARQLCASTRSEILMSLCAALLLMGVVGWRLAVERHQVPLLVLAAGVVWVLVSLYWFRDRIWPKGDGPGDALAATGVEHYRRELVLRRDHLRNEWLWHGPLVLACGTLATVYLGDRFVAWRRIESVLPLLILLVVWTAFSIYGRRRQAAQIQREIDQLP